MVSTGPVATSSALTSAVTTCLRTISLACSGVKLSKVPSGNLAKALSLGAKIVKASAFLEYQLNQDLSQFLQ